MSGAGWVLSYLALWATLYHRLMLLRPPPTSAACPRVALPRSGDVPDQLGATRTYPSPCQRSPSTPGAGGGYAPPTFFTSSACETCQALVARAGDAGNAIARRPGRGHQPLRVHGAHLRDVRRSRHPVLHRGGYRGAYRRCRHRLSHRTSRRARPPGAGGSAAVDRGAGPRTAARGRHRTRFLRGVCTPSWDEAWRIRSVSARTGRRGAALWGATGSPWMRELARRCRAVREGAHPDRGRECWTCPPPVSYPMLTGRRTSWAVPTRRFAALVAAGDWARIRPASCRCVDAWPRARTRCRRGRQGRR